MEALPDLGALSDEDLKKLIDELGAKEREVSYERRILHGKIDILRAELVARLQRSGGRSVLPPPAGHGPDAIGVREPRRPRPSQGSAGAVPPPPDEEDE